MKHKHVIVALELSTILLVSVIALAIIHRQIGLTTRWAEIPTYPKVADRPIVSTHVTSTRQMLAVMPIFPGVSEGIYIIDGKQITFHGGKGSTGSAQVTPIDYVYWIQNKTYSLDVNADGHLDEVMFVAQNGGGDKRPFFVVAAVWQPEGGFRGTDSIYIGDSIEPRGVVVVNGKVLVQYADRAVGEAYTVAPWLPKVKSFALVSGSLVEQSVQGITTSPFSEAPRTGNEGNVVGYFAYGAFTIEMPEWVVQNWKTINDPQKPENLILTPKNIIAGRDFSDIVVDVGTTTENNNANFLYDISRAGGSDNGVGTLLLADVMLAKDEKSRIYHVQRERANQIIDVFYMDGNNKTAVVSFRASKTSYAIYGAKIREFVQSLGLGKGAQG